MSVTLKIDNYTSVNIKEKTTLSADIAAAVTAIPVDNNQGIAANDYVLVGNAGSETAEIRLTASLTGAGTINTDATTLAHTKFDPVTALRGNKIRIYTAPNVNGTQPADAAFSTLLATVDIDPDQLATTYVDAGGSNLVWYKYVYYNSTTSTSTDIADSGSVRGGSVGNYCSIDDIRAEAGFDKNRNLADSLVDKMRQQAQDYINGALSGLYTLPFATPVNNYIQRITISLAAGYLEIDQYGQTYNVDTSGVNAKVAWGEKQIGMIKSGQITLTDATGTSTAIPDTNGFSGYPTSTTAAETNGGEDFMFTRDSISGYSTRKY